MMPQFRMGKHCLSSTYFQELRHRCSADWQSAVSPIANRQYVRKSWRGARPRFAPAGGYGLRQSSGAFPGVRGERTFFVAFATFCEPPFADIGGLVVGTVRYGGTPPVRPPCLTKPLETLAWHGGTGRDGSNPPPGGGEKKTCWPPRPMAFGFLLWGIFWFFLFVSWSF